MLCGRTAVELLEVGRGLIKPHGVQLLLAFCGRFAGHLHDQDLVDPGGTSQPLEQQAFVPTQGSDHRFINADAAG